MFADKSQQKQENGLVISMGGRKNRVHALAHYPLWRPIYHFELKKQYLPISGVHTQERPLISCGGFVV